jgi:hypothetical protein
MKRVTRKYLERTYGVFVQKGRVGWFAYKDGQTLCSCVDTLAGVESLLKLKLGK